MNRLRIGRRELVGDALEGCDVLVVVNALGAADMESREARRPAFSKEECAHVAAWVRSGGGLLLVADHFPMGAAAQELAQRFGVGMCKGVTLDREHAATSRAWLVFDRENGLLGDHAITRGRGARERIERVMTFTGQALEGPAGSATLLELGPRAVDVVPPERERVPVGGRAHGLALELGSGRVVVLGEAAMLSAQRIGPERIPFGMNVPGVDNRQLALNGLHWLSGDL